MQNGSLTYEQLTRKLESLGYTEERGSINNKPARLYRHKSIATARILLPDGRDEDLVEPPFVKMAFVVLKTHGLLEEQNPLAN